MDIFAKPGTIVMLNAPIAAGYLHDETLLKAKGLTEDGKYTVDHIERDSFHSYLYLREYPGVAFNTVNFCEAV